MAGVSRSTVSRVINKDPRVSDEVRTKVRAIIASTNYHPNAAARSLASRRTGIIGLVFPRYFATLFSDPWASVLIKGCLSGSEEVDLSLMLMLQTTDDPISVSRFFERTVQGRHLDGLVLASHLVNDVLVERLEASDFPYVLIGRDTDRTAHFVDIDNREASRKATCHLIEHGYRSIAMIGGPPDLITAEDRRMGFLDAMRETGRAEPELRIELGHFSQLAGYEAALVLLQTADPPDAIFAANDAMAIGAIQAARDIGLRVPEDVAVVGFDEIEVNRTYQTDLTTIRQPTEEMGRAAVAHLATMITDQPTEPVQTWLEADLIIRGSCGCASTRHQHLAGPIGAERREELRTGPAKLIVQA